MKGKNERGSFIVLFAMVIAVLLGMLALVVDYGMGVMMRSRLQVAADAAALAGAAELPDSAEKAFLTALDYCGRHGIQESEVSISFPDGSIRIHVGITRRMKYFFAPAIGKYYGTVSAGAEAANGAVGAMRGVIPIGVEQRQFVYGQLYMLKRGSGSCAKEGVPGNCSNFGPLALGGFGANIYKDNILYGYDGILRVGQWVSTETGDMVGPTRTGIDYRISYNPSETYTSFSSGSKRLVYLPIIESLDVGGRSEVMIVGFAAFFLESISGKSEVEGYFIKYRTVGEIMDSAADFNLHSVSLVR